MPGEFTGRVCCGSNAQRRWPVRPRCRRRVAALSILAKVAELQKPSAFVIARVHVRIENAFIMENKPPPQDGTSTTAANSEIEALKSQIVTLKQQFIDLEKSSGMR